MNRPFYSDYVRHMMRFYTRTANIKPTFKTEVDRINWHTCEEVMKGYPEVERESFFAIYSGFDTLTNEVFEVAQVRSVKASVVWDAMKEFERKVAKRRGLI